MVVTITHAIVLYIENNNNIRKTIGDEQSDLLITCLQRLIEKINE